MFDSSTTSLNQTFLEYLDDGSMQKKAEKHVSTYLKAQIYEDSFMQRIMPAQPISVANCDLDEHSPNYKKVIAKEFKDVRAVTTGFRGMADYQYVETDRYAVRFYKIESDEYEITEGELRGIQQPVQSLIRHHVAFHIRKQMDRQFLGLVERALMDESGDYKADQVLNFSGSTVKNRSSQGTEKILTPELLVELRNILDDRSPDYLKASTILMTQSQWNHISTWIQSNTTDGANGGPGMAGGTTPDFWKDGYPYDTLFGLRVVRTHKTDVLKKNEIYVFTEPEYLGHHFTFNDDRFAIEKHFDRMKWKGWRSFGCAIGNEYALGKLILA